MNGNNKQISKILKTKDNMKTKNNIWIIICFLSVIFISPTPISALPYGLPMLSPEHYQHDSPITSFISTRRPKGPLYSYPSENRFPLFYGGIFSDAPIEVDFFTNLMDSETLQSHNRHYLSIFPKQYMLILTGLLLLLIGPIVRPISAPVYQKPKVLPREENSLHLYKNIPFVEAEAAKEPSLSTPLAA